LIGFLPFKCARLAAILGEEDYSEVLFIAGHPHLKKNHWRKDALKEINEFTIKGRRVEDISTFLYRETLKEFIQILFSDDSLLQKYDVHLAVLGSKLQTVACWVLSNIIRSLTMVTSIPAKYFPEAFSEGIGNSWIFKLTTPLN